MGCVGEGGWIIQDAHVSGFRISNGSHWHTICTMHGGEGGDCVAVYETNEHLEDEEWKGWGGGGYSKH